MPPIELPLALPGFQVDQVSEHADMIEVIAHVIAAEAICPVCRQRSHRVHSYYQRSPADLPVADHRMRLQFIVRRFRCQNPGCVKATFAERLPTFVAPHAQRTDRLTTAVRAVAFALRGQAGRRLAVKLNMPTSGDTLLRIIRRTPACEGRKPWNGDREDDW